MWYKSLDFESDEEDIGALSDGEYTLVIRLQCGNNSAPSGAYFYRIDLPDGAESITGYLSLKQKGI